jgi:lipoprotein NlpD
MKKILLLLSTTIVLGACSFTRATPAPIVNGTTPPVTQQPTAAVSTGAAAVATTADATAPGTKIQKVDEDDDGTVVSATPAPKAKAKSNASGAVGAKTAATTAAAGAATLGGVNWLAPIADGKIVQAYSTTTKGVDVAGAEGQAVLASSAGKVVYSGNGLKGYGNLIILKHADNYLTAYSHNKVNLVKEGDTVKRGQKIAELGKTESDKPILHFELRKNGKPVNPTPIFNN